MIFSKKYYLMYSVFLMAFMPSASMAESLSEAVQAALATHPSVESARAAISAADETRVEEFSGYFPELSLSATGGRIFGDNSTSRGLATTRGSGYSYLWEGSVTARQTIFDGFETRNRLGAAKTRLDSAHFSLADVQGQLALRTLQAYIEVMQSYEGLDMLRAHEKKVADYVERIRVGVDEGTADDSQYQQARDIKVILDSFIANYESRVTAGEAAYLELTGRFPEGQMNVPPLGEGVLPPTVEEALNVADLSHPSVRSAAFGIEAVGHDVASEEAQLYPDVSGELSFLKSDKDDVIGGELEDARAVVRVNWTLETGGAQFSRIRNKKYEYDQAKSRLNELRQQVGTQVRLAYNELNTSRKQYEHQKQREDLNSKLFETYEVQFEGARISLVQLMQGHNQLFNTKLETLLGEYRVLAAEYGVLASMGQLQTAFEPNQQDVVADE